MNKDKNFFVKSHGLGNEYIVLNESQIDFNLFPKSIQTICNVNFGIGSDGILLKTNSSKADFGLRIFNPDGSEAEKSGNGLRIFCKYIYDYGFTHKKEFTVETKGGLVKATIEKETAKKANIITVDMGRAIFTPNEIPVKWDGQDCIAQKAVFGGKEFEINCVSVGNPHCVIIKDSLDIDEIKKYGPLIENSSLFPNRINVQFAQRLSDSEAKILIWERGAGFTLASGSSSCAVASVLVKRGLTGKSLKIKMIGGELKISLDTDWNIKMTGEVKETASGHLSEELVSDFR